MAHTESSVGWLQSDAQIFWGEIAPFEHIVQIYENHEAFLNLLGGFVCGGIRNGDSVIIIATSQHITDVNNRLKEQGFDPLTLAVKDQFIALDAEETLAKFMVNGWPDETLFRRTFSALLARARKQHRQVRAFGEMVSILWGKGLKSATVRLENIWNGFCAHENFCLFCAYPHKQFTEDSQTSIIHICAMHNKVIEITSTDTNEISYRDSSVTLRTADA